MKISAQSLAGEGRGAGQGGGSAPSSGVTQEVLWPFLKSEQEQSGDNCLEADCAASSMHL